MTSVMYLMISLLIPLVFLIILMKLETKLVLLMAPYACIGAYVINAIGFGGRFWYLKPLLGNNSLTPLPVNLIFYPTLGCYFLYFSDNLKISKYLLLLIFVVMTSFFEYLLILTKWLSYSHGWNIFYTSITYLISYGSGYLSYCWLKRFYNHKN